MVENAYRIFRKYIRKSLLRNYLVRIFRYKIIRIRVMTVMQATHLRLAKELIQIRYLIKVDSIRFEDGSGSKFLVTATGSPKEERFIQL